MRQTGIANFSFDRGSLFAIPGFGQVLVVGDSGGVLLSEGRPVVFGGLFLSYGRNDKQKQQAKIRSFIGIPRLAGRLRSLFRSWW
jgi:hypothetical protein